MYSNKENQKSDHNYTSDAILTEHIGSPNLLISFGGIQQEIGGIPVFEFFRSLKSIDCDKIFIRDFNQAWYQKGIDNEINTLDSFINHLRKQIEEGDHKKITLLGNSMGGYASILLGTMLNVDQVISFAPQTFIDKKNRLMKWDRRWKKQIKEVHSTLDFSQYWDLKKYLGEYTDYKTHIDIYYSSSHRLDKLHAERVKGLKGVELHEYSMGGHALVKNLRDSGKLKLILEQSFSIRI